MITNPTRTTTTTAQRRSGSSSRSNSHSSTSGNRNNRAIPTSILRIAYPALLVTVPLLVGVVVWLPPVEAFNVLLPSTFHQPCHPPFHRSRQQQPQQPQRQDNSHKVSSWINSHTRGRCCTGCAVTVKPLLKMNQQIESEYNAHEDPIHLLLRGSVRVSIETAVRLHHQIMPSQHPVDHSCHTTDGTDTTGTTNTTKVVFCDGTWWMPNSRTPTAREAFERGPRIPGAVFLDIDDLAAPPHPSVVPALPHMMPPPELWSAYMTAMGVTNQHHLIIYGQASDCPYIYRAFVQCYCMGHDTDKLHVLEGSLEDWKMAGGPLDTQPCKVTKAVDLPPSPLLTSPTADAYRAIAAREIITMTELKEIISSSSRTKSSMSSSKNPMEHIIVDARSPERFYAKVDEPRPGLRLGHMPGAKNLFFMNLVDPGKPIRLKSDSELQSILQEAGLWTTAQQDDSVMIVTTCGSGATACLLKSAFLVLGLDPSRILLYDGSWCEWGAYPDTPIVQDD